MSDNLIDHAAFFENWVLGSDQFKGAWILPALSLSAESKVYFMFFLEKEQFWTRSFLVIYVRDFSGHKINSVFQGVSFPEM